MAEKTVLIIDDDQTLVAPLKDGLESIGYRVAVAFDGMQGILQAHQAKPDVIILDFYMPGGGGRTVYERLRGAADTAKTPIIFSTVVSLEEVKGQITPTAHTYFLRKPVGLSQVISVLNSVLGENRSAMTVSAAPPPAPATVSPGPQAAPAAPTTGRTARAATSAKTPKYHEFQVRVTYADTDKLGIIYYSNYFKYFEEGRTELMRSLGVRYRDLEIQRKIYLPAVETGCRYLAPSRYDDLLVVRTWLSSMGIASVRFENEIYDRESGGRKVARGFSRHAVVNDLWRTTRIPDDLRILLEPYVGVLPGS
jgi:acyl-CoA thioester hydrolase